MAILCFMETTMVCLNMKTDVLHIHSVHYRHKVLVMMNGFALEESIFFSFGFEWDSPKIKGLEYVSKGLTGVGEGKKKGISVHLSSHNQFIELSIFLNYHSFIANCMKVTDILVVNNKH